MRNKKGFIEDDKMTELGSARLNDACPIYLTTMLVHLAYLLFWVRS